MNTPHLTGNARIDRMWRGAFAEIESRRTCQQKIEDYIVSVIDYFKNLIFSPASLTASSSSPNLGLVFEEIKTTNDLIKEETKWFKLDVNKFTNLLDSECSLIEQSYYLRLNQEKDTIEKIFNSDQSTDVHLVNDTYLIKVELIRPDGDVLCRFKERTRFVGNEETVVETKKTEFYLDGTLSESPIFINGKVEAKTVKTEKTILKSFESREDLNIRTLFYKTLKQ